MRGRTTESTDERGIGLRWHSVTEAMWAGSEWEMTAPEGWATRLGDGLLDHLQEGCQVIDRDWRYLYVNPTAARHSKFPREHLLGKRMMDVYPGFEDTVVFGLLRKCMETGEPQLSRNDFVFPDGSVGWFELSIQSIPQGIFILSTDITDRHLAEEGLRRSREEFRGLVENMEGVVFSLGADGCFTYLSPIVRVFGYEPEELVGKHCAVLAPEEDQAAVKEAFERALSGRKGTREFRFHTKDRQLRYVRCLWHVVRNGSEPLKLSGVLYDVTEHRRIEEQLRIAQKLEAIGRLAGGIAHDFNNLLSVILSYASFAQEAAVDGSQLHRDLGEVVNAGERAAALTRQLLAFSSKQVMRPQPLDLNQTIQATKPLLRRLISEDIELIHHLEPKLDTVHADPSQMEQVVMNLVLNARDAMPQGGRIVISTANVELDDAYVGMHLQVKAGPHILLSVADDGIGMSQETQARIFEPFFTTKKPGSGTGLGLSTVFGIVKQSGGNIYIYSELGQGTTIKVYLPRVRKTTGTKEIFPQTTETPRGNETILLVEDETPVRNAAERTLRAFGYKVIAASSGREALERLQSPNVEVHLLLTDVVMPEMGGVQLAGLLRQLRPHVPVLYMSGYTDDAMVQRGLQAGTVEVINKPFSSKVLAQRVRAVLDRGDVIPSSPEGISNG